MERRTFLLGASSIAAATAIPTSAGPRLRTPGQILGPYYPVRSPAEVDADLTRLRGRSQRAAGEVVRIRGRVLNERGTPVPNARIEVWQADVRGHYAHPSDKTPGAADPNFQGSAAFVAGSDGSYSFITIKPGAYPDDGAGGMRAPHIHFQVTGSINRLVTQMYFAGEALNDTDRVLAFAGRNRDRLIVAAANADGQAQGLIADWDIILRDG